jgi:hypothetical protein
MIGGTCARQKTGRASWCEVSSEPPRASAAHGGAQAASGTQLLAASRGRGGHGSLGDMRMRCQCGE